MTRETLAGAVVNRIVVAHNRLRRSEITAAEFDQFAIERLLAFADAEAEAMRAAVSAQAEVYAREEVAAMRERAAVECERIESEYWRKWKTGYDMIDQGMSDGAGVAAEAIRALPVSE